MVQEEVWKSLSQKYEIMAFQQMSKIESDHLLYVILNIPLTQHDQKSLFSLALEQKRVYFLNNDRINDVINHSYQSQFLPPEKDVNMSGRTYYESFLLILTHPFKFYFISQGYHWISGMSLMLYLFFLMVYIYLRVQNGLIWHYPHDLWGMELTLWSMNIGYITYEIFECFEKGCKEYFNLGVKGYANILDVIVSVNWGILLSLRIGFFISKLGFDTENIYLSQKIYVFFFGTQIILLTIRGLSLFTNTIYIGTLLRVIKLMLIEILKFLSIFVVVMFGFVFGLWLINAANPCRSEERQENHYHDCDDYELVTLGDTIQYVFSVFIGLGDLDGPVNQSIAVFFMGAATVFGTIILTNLLIALMTTEYENVKDAAKGEVIYNQAELTYDLSKRSRLMPPPLNIIVIIITVIIHWINFFFAFCCSPQHLNIYAKIDHQLFYNLQNWHIWYWDYDEWKSVRGVKSKYKTRKDICKFYCCAWIYDWIIPKYRKCNCICCGRHKSKKNQQIKKQILPEGHWRFHHKSCYGSMILQTDQQQKNNNIETYDGIPMSKYCDRYELKRRQKIEIKDKQLLIQLTPNTLFCKYCYRPFVPDDNDDMYNQLTTPYMALLDYISAVCFVAIPIVWIPLILLFGILAVIKWITDLCQGDKQDDAKIDKYKVTDFDKEYFADQFELKVGQNA